jgi:hypothetical protein
MVFAKGVLFTANQADCSSPDEVVDLFLRLLGALPRSSCMASYREWDEIQIVSRP